MLFGAPTPERMLRVSMLIFFFPSSFFFSCAFEGEEGQGKLLSLSHDILTFYWG